MGNFIGKLFGATTARTHGTLSYYGAPVSKTSAQAYKTSGYASIPYEKAPKVTDTVPTRDSAGNPLLPGYITPKNDWVA